MFGIITIIIIKQSLADGVPTTVSNSFLGHAVLNNIYSAKNHSHFSPAGAESDSNPTAAAPSQTEITGLNCSDHSTTSSEIT